MLEKEGGKAINRRGDVDTIRRRSRKWKVREDGRRRRERNNGKRGGGGKRKRGKRRGEYIGKRGGRWVMIRDGKRRIKERWGWKKKKI